MKARRGSCATRLGAGCWCFFGFGALDLEFRVCCFGLSFGFRVFWHVNCYVVWRAGDGMQVVRFGV